jgi:hypothetical protein
MRSLRIALAILFLAAAFLIAGCRVAELGGSILKNQENTAEGILYTDSLFTDDGHSRLAR